MSIVAVRRSVYCSFFPVPIIPPLPLHNSPSPTVLFCSVGLVAFPVFCVFYFLSPRVKMGHWVAMTKALIVVQIRGDDVSEMSCQRNSNNFKGSKVLNSGALTVDGEWFAKVQVRATGVKVFGEKKLFLPLCSSNMVEWLVNTAIKNTNKYKEFKYFCFLYFHCNRQCKSLCRFTFGFHMALVVFKVSLLYIFYSQRHFSPYLLPMQQFLTLIIGQKFSNLWSFILKFLADIASCLLLRTWPEAFIFKV